jgi:hypothetical protein
MPIDRFSNFSDGPETGSRAPFAITPHDVTEIPIIPKALYIGTGGTVVLRGIDASADATFINVPNGFILDVRAQFVRATGTTASNIVALA